MVVQGSCGAANLCLSRTSQNSGGYFAEVCLSRPRPRHPLQNRSGLAQLIDLQSDRPPALPPGRSPRTARQLAAPPVRPCARLPARPTDRLAKGPSDRRADRSTARRTDRPHAQNNTSPAHNPCLKQALSPQTTQKTLPQIPINDRINPKNSSQNPCAFRRTWAPFLGTGWGGAYSPGRLNFALPAGAWRLPLVRIWAWEYRFGSSRSAERWLGHGLAIGGHRSAMAGGTLSCVLR